MKNTTVVFIPATGAGHVFAAMEFGALLLNLRDSLTLHVFIVPDSHERFNQSVSPLHPRMKIINLPMAEPPLENRANSFEKFIYDLFALQAGNVRTALAEVEGEGFRIAGLVMDFFCVSLMDVADELSIPSFLFLNPSAGFYRFMQSLTSRGDSPLRLSDPNSNIPGFRNPFPSGMALDPCFNTEGGYTTMQNIARRMKDAKGVVINTFAELECRALNAIDGDEQRPPTYAVGPVLNFKGYVNAGMQCGEIMAWLDKQPHSSVVFICFGSTGTFPESDIKEIAKGIEKSNRRFIWCLKISEGAEAMLPEGFAERTNGRGMVCGWVKQVDILAHSAIGGFVSHCGWNSILESIWYGVPIATLPIRADQHLNAFEMVKELGMSAELKNDYRRGMSNLSAEEVASGIAAVMEENCEAREKVKEMSKLARKAVMEGGSSYSALHHFAKEMLDHA